MAKTPRTSTRKPKTEPQRNNRARAVSELLPGAGGAAFRRFGFVQHAIVSRWGEIVGERYARVSAPESIQFPRGKRDSGVLSLVVSGAHGTMLQHVAPEIVERVNRFFGYAAVEKLSIRQGDVARPGRAVPPPAPSHVPDELGESLRNIADPELKAVLEALAAGVAAQDGEPAPAPIPKIGKIS